MTRLEPMLIRVPPEEAASLRELAKRTRIRLADYHREALTDLLRKHGALPTSPAESNERGAA